MNNSRIVHSHRYLFPKEIIEEFDYVDSLFSESVKKESIDIDDVKLIQKTFCNIMKKLPIIRDDDIPFEAEEIINIDNNGNIIP